MWLHSVRLCMKAKSGWQGSPSISLHCFNGGRFSGWTWMCSTASLASQLPSTPANEDRHPYPPIQVSLLYGQHLSHWARSPVCTCFVVGFWYPLLTSLHSLSILLLLASINHVYGVGVLTFFMQARACSMQQEHAAFALLQKFLSICATFPLFIWLQLWMNRRKNPLSTIIESCRFIFLSQVWLLVS